MKPLHDATNPFAMRLMRHGGPFSHHIVFYTSLVSGLLTSLMAMFSAAQAKPVGYFLSSIQGIIFIASLSLMVSLPLFVTYAATAVVVTYTQSSEYPFLCLTNLPSGAIVQGFLLATFYRCRALVALVFALCPALSLTMSAGGMLSTMYPDTLGFGLAESLLRHLVMGVLLAGMVGGISLLGVTVGIGLGLWWRHTTVANTAATVALFIFAFWLLDKLGEFFYGLGLFGFANDALQALLFVLITCLLAWLTLRLSRQWARKL